MAALPAGRSVHYDRQGRGDSSDTQPYAVEWEVEDLASLIKEAGGQAAVFGRELNETAVGFAQAGTPG